jgi:uncharacterized membrane protein
MTDPTPRSKPDSRKPKLIAALEHAASRIDDAERYIRGKLDWNDIYRATSYLRSALWVVPIIAILLVLAIAPVLRVLDVWLEWRFFGLSMTGAQSLYQTVITFTLSFLVFTFSSLLVAIQVAGGQLTPRIIATTLLRDNVVRYSVGLFVFTLLFAVMALNRLEMVVLDIVAFLTVVLGIACLATFLFLIDYAARLLRPVSILARVGDEGLSVIKAVYPRPAGDTSDVETVYPALPESPRRTVHHMGMSEIVVAIDLVTLLRRVRRSGGVIEFVPQVGDFVATDEPLFVLYGDAVSLEDQALRATVAFGRERTMEQDPLFSFRILADVALKALSPAINDPTTAVLAIDQIHRLLRVVGKGRLRGEAIKDSTGHRRVILRTPNWEDFVHLACTEIRMYGAGSVQVARRLRAMFDNLIATLPSHRHQALDEERRRLERMLDSFYPVPEDLALARVPDSQGIGGSSRGVSAGR